MKVYAFYKCKKFQMIFINSQFLQPLSSKIKKIKKQKKFNSFEISFKDVSRNEE